MIASGVLYTNVMDKLHFEPNIDESNITISVRDDGIVVLGGKVKSYTEKYLAANAVKKLERVKGVANELMVDLAIGYKRNDTDIVESALSTLKWTMFVPHDRIKVAVSSGHITLSGDVDSYFQAQRAEKAVRDLYGATGVTNELKVIPTTKINISASEVKEKIIQEFERSARIDAKNIRVEVDGSKVTLKGNIRNLDEDTEAKRAAWSVPGVSSVIDNLTISW